MKKTKQKQLEDIHNNFYKFIDGLVYLNKHFRSIHSFDDRNPYYYIESCTVRINLGRQAGHTTYIKNKAKRNDVIIGRKDVFFNKNDEYEFRNSNVFTIEEIVGYYTDGIEMAWPINNIFIDNYSYNNTSALLTKIVDRFKNSMNRHTTIICLG